MCCYAVVVTHLSDLFLCLACESCDNLVWELYSLDLLHELLGDISLRLDYLSLSLYKVVYLVYEPSVYLGDVIDLVV